MNSYPKLRAIAEAALEHESTECNHSPHRCLLVPYYSTFRPQFVLGLMDRAEAADRYKKGLRAVQELIDESKGVAGLHLNGDVADWDELLAGGRFEEWLRDFSAALNPTAYGAAAMNKPKRIQRKRTKGWRMPENAVYVGRPSKWGNPFYPEDYDQAGATWAVTRFAECCQSLMGLAREELKGRDLACWCPLDQPCHADVLLEWANS